MRRLCLISPPNLVVYIPTLLYAPPPVSSPISLVFLPHLLTLLPTKYLYSEILAVREWSTDSEIFWDPRNHMQRPTLYPAVPPVIRRTQYQRLMIQQLHKKPIMMISLTFPRWTFGSDGMSGTQDENQGRKSVAVGKRLPQQRSAFWPAHFRSKWRKLQR